MSSTLLLPPRTQLCNRSCSNKTHTHTHLSFPPLGVSTAGVCVYYCRTTAGPIMRLLYRVPINNTLSPYNAHHLSRRFVFAAHTGLQRAEVSTIVYGVLRGKNCMHRLFRSNCHMLALSLGTFGNALIAFMPADRRFYCIYCARNLKILAFVSANIQPTNCTVKNHSRGGTIFF